MNQTAQWLEAGFVVAAVLGVAVVGALLLLGTLVWLAGWRRLR